MNINLSNTTPKVIAEIGCNHKGDMGIAKKMIKVAAECGADVAKFQKREPIELLSSEVYNSPHPNPANSYGATYGEHREFLEFSAEQHKELLNFCNEVGIAYSASVWDLTSAEVIAALQPEIIKIGSPSNLHFEMIAWLCKNYNGQIHISFGMTTPDEQEQIVSFFESYGRAQSVVIYSCTSGYPVPFEDICLMEIIRLKKRFSHRVAQIGFSGHHLGIAADVAAMTLGAEWIERHFTLDRTWKGTDHAASLEPQGLHNLCRDLHNVSKALTFKQSDILPIEDEQRKKLKWISESNTITNERLSKAS